jgi:hypothetical protein
MAKTRHIYIDLLITDGEREHNHRTAFSTNCENLGFAVLLYQFRYWGHGYRESREDINCWFDGVITCKIEKWKEVTYEEANFINELIYG